MLEVQDIHCYYGASYILQGISLKVKEKEIACLLGRNGVGKTTTLKSVMGILPPRRGSIQYKNKNIVGLKSHEIARLGIGYVPEARRIFPDLTTVENLLVAEKDFREGGWDIDVVLQLFPALKKLKNSKGRYLSGGEQQMLAIARALMGNPEFMLLDEPSAGLAPIVIASLVESIKEIKQKGVSMLLSEQNSHLAAKISDNIYVIDHHQIVFEGSVDTLLQSEEELRQYIAI